METVRDFNFFFFSKITADGDCSHESKKCLLLGRKAMIHLDSIWKSRDVTLPKNVHLNKATVFPVVMYGCKSWTIKKAEHWIIDALELWCWRRLLRVPWTARRSNHSILKEINLEYSLEGLILKLKLRYFGHLIWRTDSLEKIWSWERLKTIGKGDDRGWDGWMTSPTLWTCIWTSFRSWWWTGRPGQLQSMGFQRVRDYWGTELNWFSGEKILAKSMLRRKEIESESGSWGAVPMPYLENFPKGLMFDKVKIMWRINYFPSITFT